MDRNRQSDEGTGGSQRVTDRERPAEDGMQGVAGERERMGGYGYDTPADMEQASDTGARETEGTDEPSGS